MTNSDKITNASIMLELFNGYTVEMRQLTVKQMAELDAYVRGKFIKNTLEAVKELDPAQEDRIIRNLALSAQQMVWTDRAATVIFETEVDGLAYYAYKYVEKSYHGDFNSWKDLFNANRDENARLFYLTRYALYFSSIKRDSDSAETGITGNQDPEYIYKLVDAALKAGLALNTILELTPEQIALIIGDRDKVAAVNDGKLHFRDADEFSAWREAREKEKQEEEIL
jgi:hypothetical protein